VYDLLLDLKMVYHWSSKPPERFKLHVKPNLLMGRGRDFRGGGSGRGRHGRDEDQNFLDSTATFISNLSAPRPDGAENAKVEATVKWFNPEKGFGFVEIADGSGDAFLPAKALQVAGRENVSPGAKLSVFVGQGEKGRQVTKIVAIEESGKSAPAYSTLSASQPQRPEADLSDAKEVLGKVKWFSIEKGMGFVAPQDGGKDVFVHISVVKKAHIAELAEGQRISMRIIETPKGRQAASIEAID
jgi:CspA family cold shock protein